MRAEVTVQRVVKQRKIFRADGNARRLRMSAELQQKIFARRNRFEDIDRDDRPRGSFIKTVYPRKQDDGAGIFFRKARRDDTDKSRAPVVAFQHDDVAVRTFFCDLRFCDFVKFIAFRLPLDVIGIQLYAKIENSPFVFR